MEPTVKTASKNLRQTIKVYYLQPAFLICAGVLALTGSAVSVAIELSGIYLKKEPLELKKPLNQLDNFNLSPYKIVSKQEIDNPDMLETLGTEDYIEWNLEDTSAPADSNVRFCTLFVTYYGLPDKVPHVPEECYIGGGLRQVSAETVTLTTRYAAAGISSERQISTRYLVFAGAKSDVWGGEITFPTFYTFSVNGEYAGGREDARLILNKNLFGKFSYFSKVEWKFYNNRFGRAIYPNKQEALVASEKLLAMVLPVLEKEHWPSGLW